MKTFKFICMVVAVTLFGMCFTACSDDDDDNGSNINVKTSNSVTLQSAGTLSLRLGDKIKTITSLKVSGPLNGDDIICLRQMLRCTDEESSTRGMLTTLDLSDASIVSGGDAYYNSYKTSNNEIGSYMFNNCESLEAIALPNSVTTIKSNVFENCKNFAKVSLGKSLESISDYAFERCSSLLEVTIPNSVTYLGGGAFMQCSSLEKLTLSSSLESIYSITFYMCQSLKEVTIPNSVKSIEGLAFWGCSCLEVLTIGSGVSSISSSAFESCGELKEINLKTSTPPTIYSGTFKGVDVESCVLYVPAGTKGAYSKADYWSDFKNIKEV